MGHLTLTCTDTKPKSHMHAWVWVPLYISMVTQILMGWFVIHTVLYFFNFIYYILYTKYLT